ncbi:unnamed protein product [Rangifer tarandus platyrhynchus]|uniref:Uncharacterized protein n=1 Tax=Rangifer tarandus platyrhynchus TaxID=3082113 RepID=A0AC59YA26_RANTA
MGTPVARTPGGETSIQAQDKSQITSPLQVELGGPCKGVDIRYFFSASSTFWEPVLYGGCEAKGNNFLRAADCRRTAVATEPSETALYGPLVAA